MLYNLLESAFHDRMAVAQPIDQASILDLKQFAKNLAFANLQVSVMLLKKTDQNLIQFTCSAATPIKNFTLIQAKRRVSTICAQNYFLPCIASLI